MDSTVSIRSTSNEYDRVYALILAAEYGEHGRVNPALAAATRMAVENVLLLGLHQVPARTTG